MKRLKVVRPTIFSPTIPAALLLLVPALLLSACTGTKALIITGESVALLGETFERVAPAMEKALDERVITAEQYRKWRVFGEKFVVAYPLAADLWKTAEAHRDEQLCSQAGAAVAALAADLGQWAALVGVK